MDFNLQPDTPEISAFRKEVREWLAENMRGSEHLRWSARWSTRENDDEYQFRRQLANKLGYAPSGLVSARSLTRRQSHGAKQETEPVWHAGPFGRTRRR